MKSFLIIVYMITLGAGLAFSEVPPVYAQEEEFTLEEITVTAERRNTDLQNLALSVTVQNGDEMLQQGRSSLTQMLQEVPGIVIQTSDNDKDMGQDNEVMMSRR